MLWDDLMSVKLGPWRWDTTARLISLIRADSRRCRFCILGVWEKQERSRDRAARGGAGAERSRDRGPTEMVDILVPKLIRAYVGHSLPFIDGSRITSALRENHRRLFSTLCHRTRLDRLESIFQMGLLGGRDAGQSARTALFLSGFASGDARNLAAGRQEAQYDCEIILDDAAVFDQQQLALGMNGCIMANFVPTEHIVMVYALDKLDGSVLPLETVLDDRGRRHDRCRGLIDKKVDLNRGRRLIFHREFVGEEITHLHYPADTDFTQRRLQSGAIIASGDSGTMQPVKQDRRYKDPESWSADQKSKFCDMPRRLTPCCGRVLPYGFLECRRCGVEFSFRGFRVPQAAAAAGTQGERPRGRASGDAPRRTKSERSQDRVLDDPLVPQPLKEAFTLQTRETQPAER